MEPSKKIPLRIRLAYSIGHFQNDLMASMWFSYLLVYLHQVRNFNNIYAGTLLLVGQIADAIATPLIGYESDANSGCCGYTKRKSWHLFGTICTTCSFPFIFAPVIGATTQTEDYALFVYYAAFVIIFQIGWASVQISHLSLIPDLTQCQSEVAGLNGWRYAATGIANLATYAIAWVILASGNNVNNSKLTHADAGHFRNIAFIVTGIGLVTSVVFHLCVPEPKCETHFHAPAETTYGAIAPCDEEAATQSIEKSTIRRSRRRDLKDWFKDVRFYQVALIYMCTRLFVNISQVYLPMYLTETIELDKETIANVPLVCYASSFFTATLLKVVDKQMGRVKTYVAGLFFALGSAAFVYFIPAKETWMVYLASILIGIGGALILVTSLSFVADLIGDFTGSSAFVYGAMSFTDKLANGVAVEIVQIFHPCVNCCPACKPYYRKVQTFVPGGAAALALVGLCTLACSAISTRVKVPQLMYDPTSVNHTVSNGHTPNSSAANEANGTSDQHGHSPYSTKTVAEVHSDPSISSLNGDGRLAGDSESEDETAETPLLRARSGRHSKLAAPAPYDI
ncbi:major facilitator superfamily domain-containing protein 12-like isoform X2 [Littorina saxatilis]|uniref:Major facilitator superfamily domain-containing protein 12 n=1 Tax=Littorina saxatilis TaxID=31220 RepID=A0AAN9GQS2_9CAEN